MTEQPESPLAVILRDLIETTPYAHGVMDVLRLLGLVSVEDPTPTGKVAELVLASLAAHRTDRTVVRFNWNDLNATGLRGVDMLRAIETARLAHVAQPTPGRSERVAQVIIKGKRGGEDVYLMQYDGEARQYQPIGGKWEVRDGDTIATARREIAEELALGRALTVEECMLVPLESGWEKTQISATYGILTRYNFDFYHATAMQIAVIEDADTRWIPREEIAAGQAADGRTISTLLVEAIGWDRLDKLEALEE